jgi:flagellar biosynthesis/type III secretory pathway protein FliH
MRYVAPASTGQIREALAEALVQTTPTLLHLRVEPDSAQRLRQQILQRLSAAPSRG